MDLLFDPLGMLLATARDVLPVLVMLTLFHLLVLRRPIPGPTKVIAGFAFILVGMTLFLMGLELALFPLGELMATQLSSAIWEMVGVPSAGSRSSTTWSFSRGTFIIRPTRPAAATAPLSSNSSRSSLSRFHGSA